MDAQFVEWFSFIIAAIAIVVAVGSIGGGTLSRVDALVHQAEDKLGNPLTDKNAAGAGAANVAQIAIGVAIVALIVFFICLGLPPSR